MNSTLKRPAYHRAWVLIVGVFDGERILVTTRS